MISVNFFTSAKHTRPVIEALKKGANIKLLNVSKKLDRPQKADVFIVADFGEILPPKILSLPRHGSLCLHPSLLPKYRGASPVQYAIMNGDKETGLTLFEMDEKIDHGPIISQFKEPIRDDDTAETLYQRLFTAGAQVLVTILPSYIAGKIKPRPQDHSKATYAPQLTREDGRINWQKSEQEIERFIRAMTPWPGAWTKIHQIHSRSGIAPAAHCGSGKGEKRLKILEAHLEKGKLVLDRVQLEGKKPITWKQFLAGHSSFEFS